MTSKQKSDTRKWLNRYRFLVKEINAREKHLSDFILDIYNPLQAVSLNGMPKGHGTPSDSTYNTYCNIEKTFGGMLTDMQNRIDDLQAALTEIDNALNSLDEYERCVCYHRFVLGVNWVDMPDYIGYEQKQCQRIEVRALDRVHSITSVL